MNNNSELRTYLPTPLDGAEAEEYPEQDIGADQQRELLHGYYAAVSFIDSLIADLLRELQGSGKADNTIIVVWGDHGFHLGDHGLWGKHTTMEQANRVPLMILVPGNKSGYAHTLVELLDLFPTLADLAGLEIPAFLQGKSLTGAASTSARVRMVTQCALTVIATPNGSYRMAQWFIGISMISTMIRVRPLILASSRKTTS
jgi:iduronate 2-sulfatase